MFTIVPTSPVVLNTTSSLSFVVPPSHTGFGLTCLARGWPVPEIMLIDENGQALANSYQSCESSVVSASLILDDDIFKQGAVRCMATNSFGEDSQTMQLYVGEAEAPTFSPSSPSETDGSTTIRFTLRVLTSDCLQSAVSGAAITVIMWFGNFPLMELFLWKVYAFSTCVENFDPLVWKYFSSENSNVWSFNIKVLYTQKMDEILTITCIKCFNCLFNLQTLLHVCKFFMT